MSFLKVQIISLCVIIAMQQTSSSEAIMQKKHNKQNKIGVKNDPSVKLGIENFP